MARFTKAILRITRSTDMAYIYKMMDLCLLENIQKGKNKEVELQNGPTETSIEDIGQMMSWKDTDNLIGLMEMSIQATGSTMCAMVQVYSNGQTVMCLRECSKKTRKMERVN
jgi:hypothetical protein